MMRNESGFTIIELLITLAVAGIVVAVALPNYNIFVKNNCLTTATNTLVSSFQLARSEAIKRGLSVGLDTTAGWTSWNVFVDTDGDSVHDLDGTEPVLRAVTLTCGVNATIAEINGSLNSAPPNPAGPPNPIDTAANQTTFIYLSNGFIQSAGTFDLCDDRTAERGRQITISITGRPNTNAGFICS